MFHLMRDDLEKFRKVYDMSKERETLYSPFQPISQYSGQTLNNLPTKHDIIDLTEIMKTATTEFEKQKKRLVALERENRHLKTDHLREAEKFTEVEAQLEKYITNYAELTRESNDESKRNATEIKELTKERNKWKEEWQIVNSFFEMERDQAAAVKEERDELRLKFDALESEHMAALKMINPNDPKAIPRAQLEDPFALKAKEDPKGASSPENGSVQPRLAGAEGYVPPPPAEGQKLPPPPVHAEVKSFPVSAGPSPPTMSFPGVKPAPSPYVPPPPQDGAQLPPPPVHAEVKTFPVSDGPPPPTMSFPGIPKGAGSYIPPPPADGSKIPPPPVHADV